MSASVIPARPRLKPWYRVAHVEDGVVVEHGDSVLRLGGGAATTLLPELLPLLDGTRTPEELHHVLGEPIAPAVEHALDVLASRGLLADGPVEDAASLRARTARFLAASSAAGRSEREISAALRASAVDVAGEGSAAAEIVRLLRLSGVASVEHVTLDDDRRDLLAVVAPSSAELASLAQWNRARLDSGEPWLLVAPLNGRFAAIGPFVVPGQTACYQCFRLRRAANSGYGDVYSSLEGASADGGASIAFDGLVAGAAASLVLRWITECDPRVPGRFFALETDDALRLEAHVVYRVPRCSDCSPLARSSDPLPWGDFA